MAEEWTRAKPLLQPQPTEGSVDEWERAAPKPGQISLGQQVDELTDEDDPFFTGLLQGGTLGWWDELASGVESVYKGKNYRELWKERQKQLERYRHLAPGRMIGGELTGALATSIIPGAVLGRVGKAAVASKEAIDLVRAAKAAEEVSRLAKVAKAVKPIAAAGAVQGVGQGSTPYTNPKYKHPLAAAALLPIADAGFGAVDATLGYGLMRGTTAATGKLTAPVTKPLKKGASWLLEKTAKPFFNVPQGAAKEVLENPEVYKKPFKDLDTIVKGDIEPVAKKLSETINKEQAEAVALLDDKVSKMTPKRVQQILQQKLKEKKVLIEDPNNPGRLISRHGKGVIENLKGDVNLAKNIAGKKGYLTEKGVHEFYQDIAGRAKYSSNQTPGSSSKEVADAYKMARGAINEELSDPNFGGNAAYNNKMKFVREATDELDSLQRALGLGKGIKTAKFEAPNATYGKLRQIRKNEPLQERIQSFAEKYGDKDLLAQIKRATNEKHFGLKSPSFGTSGGGGAFGWPGFIAGLIRDVPGPNLWKAMATRTAGTSGPGPLGSLLSPAAAYLSVNPILEEQYIGRPLYGEPPPPWIPSP